MKVEHPMYNASEPSVPTIFARMSPPRPTPVFDTYWQFASQRHAVYQKRLRGAPGPWTSNPILTRYKFTNAFRACDRTSQYLIRNVIYSNPTDGVNCIFRILLFKLFNRIETWTLLEERLGELNCDTFNWHQCKAALADARLSGKRIYSAAYIMPPTSKTSAKAKHESHLDLLQQMMMDQLPDQLLEAETFARGYELLLSYSGIGPFLAYQFMTDLNYSDHFSFSEMDFVKPGPGAIDGLTKCFSDYGDFSEADLIRWVAYRQHRAFERADLSPCLLGSRPLQLVDCQNLFCEVDKYARVAHPEFKGVSGRSRIKQQFHPRPEISAAWFPPKWQINLSR